MASHSTTDRCLVWYDLSVPLKDQSNERVAVDRTDPQFLQSISKNWYLLASYLAPIAIVMALISARDRLGIEVQWFGAGAKYLLAAVGFSYLCYLAYTSAGNKLDGNKK